ncbi:MAG: hypothetical protein FGM46_09825 [Ferruginibacter sp.]|nr:hypothetical protein [Ferruginibacter sp.]
MNYCLYDKYLRFKEYDYNEPLKSAIMELHINFTKPNEAFKNGEIIYQSIDGKAPKTSITLDMMFDFYCNPKSDFEIHCFLAFCALKSIIQRQEYIKTDFKYLVSRMSGNSKKNEVIDPLLNRYEFKDDRYQRNKLIRELRLSWGLKYIAGNKDFKVRGFYASFTMQEKDLAVIAVKANRKYKLNKLKQKTDEAIKYANEQIQKESLQENIKNDASNSLQDIDKK